MTLGDVVCFEEVLRILQNSGSSVLQEEDNPNRAKNSSASRLYESQSCFLRLVNVRWGGSGRFIYKELPSWTMIGRWWEQRVVRVRHSQSKTMWEEVIVRLGEVGSL